MPSDPVKLNQSFSGEAEKHKQLDREIREMVSAITHRVTDFHKSSGSGGSGQNLEDDEDGGVRVVTLAGTNNGATLRSELDGKLGQSREGVEAEALSTYVNSNFQAINNSMMLGGSYQANDPGVHLDVSEFTEPPQAGHREKGEKQGKKGKKKEKENSKSDHHSEHSD
ncbi:uncharacterized protein G2W53_042394 [Senna tora]|uniref:Uncharacterized protein n=1 Tax=Senna tora TaxID=362788 RepID=A0A834VYY0_9FABA|nr:uncharacterized protein G2W53_042394 [Senna tora]